MNINSGNKINQDVEEHRQPFQERNVFYHTLDQIEQTFNSSDDYYRGQRIRKQKPR